MKKAFSSDIPADSLHGFGKGKSPDPTPYKRPIVKFRSRGKSSEHHTDGYGSDYTKRIVSFFGQWEVGRLMHHRLSRAGILCITENQEYPFEREMEVTWNIQVRGLLESHKEMIN